MDPANGKCSSYDIPSQSSHEEVGGIVLGKAINFNKFKVGVIVMERHCR